MYVFFLLLFCLNLCCRCFFFFLIFFIFCCCWCWENREKLRHVWKMINGRCAAPSSSDFVLFHWMPFRYIDCPICMLLFHLLMHLILFPFGVQHFHEKGLCGSTSSAVFQIEMIFTTCSHRMDFRNNTYQFCKFLLFVLMVKVCVCFFLLASHGI